MSDDEILNRKQTLLIYPQGAGGHLIQRILHRIRDNKLYNDIIVSTNGDCHYMEPQGNYDTLELHHYSHLSVTDNFDYKRAVLNHYKQHKKTDSIVKMHPGDSPYLVDKLSKFLPNTEFAVIQTSSYVEELACSLMQIKKWDLSPNQWNITKNELIEFFPSNTIIRNAAQFKSLTDITFEFECYLTWMVFLRSGYPTIKFDDTITTPKSKVNFLKFSDIFDNNSQQVVEFCSAILHRKITIAEQEFISTQLSNYVQKQNSLLINDPVGYLRTITKVASDFEANNNRRYRTSNPTTSIITNLKQSIVVIYRAGSSGQFISGIIHAIKSNRLTTDLVITSEGEYKRNQSIENYVIDMHRDFSLQNLITGLYYARSAEPVIATHVNDIATIKKLLPNCKIVVSSAETTNDKLAAWFNAMNKHSLGIERWADIYNPTNKPLDREEAILSLSSRISDVPGMISALNRLPLPEQKDILLSALIGNNEMIGALNIEEPLLFSDMYSIPFSYTRFGDVDGFTSSIDKIISLNKKSEDFVRRNFINYYNKQNHLMMHDPEKYIQQIKEKATTFLDQFR